MAVHTTDVLFRDHKTESLLQQPDPEDHKGTGQTSKGTGPKHP